MTKLRTTKKETRAVYYSINATALARDARVKLGKMRIKIERLQEPWLEVDSMIEQSVAKALAAMDDLIKQFGESAEYMNEPIDA